jgi:DNA gyrase/topoisomerase IV subunit A
MNTASRTRRPGREKRRSHDKNGASRDRPDPRQRRVACDDGAGQVRTPANEIRTIGRATQGVKLMDLKGEDKIVSVALVEAAIAEEGAAMRRPAG